MTRANPNEAEAEHIRQVRAQRIRAARAYAGLQQPDIASLLGVAVVTIKRMERGQREITLDKCYAIADRCGVPRSFMDDGFANYQDQSPATGEEVRALRAAIVDALDSRIEALTEALLSRDQALQASRQALTHLRERANARDLTRD